MHVKEGRAKSVLANVEKYSVKDALKGGHLDDNRICTWAPNSSGRRWEMVYICLYMDLYYGSIRSHDIPQTHGFHEPAPLKLVFFVRPRPHGESSKAKATPKCGRLPSCEIRDSLKPGDFDPTSSNWWCVVEIYWHWCSTCWHTYNLYIDLSLVLQRTVYFCINQIKQKTFNVFAFAKLLISNLPRLERFTDAYGKILAYQGRHEANASASLLDGGEETSTDRARCLAQHGMELPSLRDRHHTY